MGRSQEHEWPHFLLPHSHESSLTPRDQHASLPKVTPPKLNYLHQPHLSEIPPLSLLPWELTFQPRSLLQQASENMSCPGATSRKEPGYNKKKAREAGREHCGPLDCKMDSTCKASGVRQLVANPKAQLELRSNSLGYLCSPVLYDSIVLHTCKGSVLE